MIDNSKKFGVNRKGTLTVTLDSYEIVDEHNDQFPKNIYRLEHLRIPRSSTIEFGQLSGNREEVKVYSCYLCEGSGYRLPILRSTLIGHYVIGLKITTNKKLLPKRLNNDLEKKLLESDLPEGVKQVIMVNLQSTEAPCIVENHY